MNRVARRRRCRFEQISWVENSAKALDLKALKPEETIHRWSVCFEEFGEARTSNEHTSSGITREDDSGSWMDTLQSMMIDPAQTWTQMWRLVRANHSNHNEMTAKTSSKQQIERRGLQR